MPDDVLAAWEAAWTTPDTALRVASLERALAADGELVYPAGGRLRGRDAVAERIAGFHERFPGARLEVTSGLDEHHGFARWSWTITAPGGDTILDGIDVFERADDGRLRRVVMFFGALPPG